MKRNVLLASAWMFASLTAFSQTTEDFNSRPGTSVDEVKGFLQDHCWMFSNMETSSTGWQPGIEGDGTIRSASGNFPGQVSKIYTPLLEVPGSITVTFKYKFNSNVNGALKRWFKLYLVNAENEIQSQLDVFEISNASNQEVYTYSKSFGAGSGLYKLLITYEGNQGSTRVGIDELEVSASQHYSLGCNSAPVAVDDHINGLANRTAHGNICGNDYDTDNDPFNCYIITNSPNGTVTINPDRSFSFTPNPGFAGNSTTFTYQVCESGLAPLCSNTATVTINFPTGGFLPVSMIDFHGLYKNDGNVEISWTTTFEQNSDKFIIERSLTGNNWEEAGRVAGKGISTVKTTYSYIDRVGRNTANKKDLYYRLKMIDKDGQVTVSRILVVRVYNTPNTKMISVSPNPAKNDIAATVQLNQSSVVVFRVLSGSGTEVMRKTYKLGEGSNNILLDGTARLNPGMYILEVVVNNHERMLVKLIKE